MEITKTVRLRMLMVVCGVAIHGWAADIDRSLAKQYFAEAHQLCTEDGGKLWGHSLCGPLMFADRASRDIVTNQADAEGQLKPEDGVFVGQLPSNLSPANTSTEWAGVLWTQVMWPLPEDRVQRRLLLAHESFHRVQRSLPQRASGTARDVVDSLDSASGRFLLQMEWRALARALRAPEKERKESVADALVFRARRHELFPADTENELRQEANEGLAEYTGVKLGAAGSERQVQLAISGLAEAAQKPSFVRSFAYGSGPAYGLLLDEYAPGWRKDELTNYQDMALLLQRAMKIEQPQNLALAVERLSGKYDGAALMAAEVSREKARAERVAAFRARLVDGPVLHIPLVKMQIRFNPNNLLPMQDLGTAYPDLRITDNWGVLEVTKGALLAPDWKSVTVAAPNLPASAAPTQATATKIEGDGWTLDLKPGWSLKAGTRAGDFELTSSEEKRGEMQR